MQSVAKWFVGLALVVPAATGCAGSDAPDAAPDAVDKVAVEETADTADDELVAPGGRPTSESAAALIERLELRVREVPNDDVAWATLGLAYVERARITADTALYGLADGALSESLAINDETNFSAQAGLAAVAAARHDFVTAEREALAGLEINPKSAALLGILSDAQIQLGRYDEGFATVQEMVDLQPGTSSLARVAYTHELVGDVDEARTTMERVLEEAPNDADRAFALVQLGELDLGRGDADPALGRFLEALDLTPENVGALAGKAHALGVLRQTETAIDAYQELVDAAPLADFLIEFGEFLSVSDRPEEAEALFARARQRIEADEAEGVRPDAGLIFFEADRGDPAKALAAAEAAVAERPFIENHEAYGWALHLNGRDEEALVSLETALEVGLLDAELYLRYAVVLDATGDRDAALVQVRAGRAIDPTVSIPAAAALLAAVG